MYDSIAILALFAFAYSLVAERVARTPVNGALVYLVFGVVAGPVGLGLLDLSIGGEGLRAIAELTLALVLFSDAANADLGVLRRFVLLPTRMLLIGLPLTSSSASGSAGCSSPSSPSSRWRSSPRSWPPPTPHSAGRW